MAPRREWGLSPLCAAVATFSRYCKHRSRPINGRKDFLGRRELVRLNRTLEIYRKSTVNRPSLGPVCLFWFIAFGRANLREEGWAVTHGR